MDWHIICIICFCIEKDFGLSDQIGKETMIMSRGDRTGPEGMGPMSGRAAGYCARFDMPGFANRPYRQVLETGPEGDRRRGSRGGHGWRHMFWATGLPGWMRQGNYRDNRQKMDLAFEKQSLKYQEDILQSHLDIVRQRLSEFDSPDSGV